MNAKIVLILPLLLCSLSYGAYLKQLRQLNLIAERIQSPGHSQSHTQIAQQKLFAELKRVDIGKDKRALPLLENIISALAHQEAFPVLHENANILVKATQALFKITGFSGTFKKTISSAENEDCFKGNLFELEHALKITESQQPETILGFGVIIKYKKKQREFDIVTDKRCIECKNISWVHKKNDEKLKCQFLDQRKLVAAYNRTTRKASIYQVVSKQPIPATWQEWFKQQDIATTH
jgi:hypothetical protein